MSAGDQQPRGLFLSGAQSQSVNAKQLEQPVFQAEPLQFAKRTAQFGASFLQGLGSQIGASPITDAIAGLMQIVRVAQ